MYIYIYTERERGRDIDIYIYRERDRGLQTGVFGIVEMCPALVRKTCVWGSPSRGLRTPVEQSSSRAKSTASKARTLHEKTVLRSLVSWIVIIYSSVLVAVKIRKAPSPKPLLIGSSQRGV